MFKLVRNFEGGRSVLCTDGRFHHEGSVGSGKPYKLKIYKTDNGAYRCANEWNANIEFCVVEKIA